MITDMSLEEMDFSVRTFNCLKRARIETATDLYVKIEEGISALFSIRGLNNKRECVEEILTKAKRLGYPAEKIIDEYLLDQQNISAPEQESWLFFKEALLSVENLKPSDSTHYKCVRCGATFVRLLPPKTTPLCRRCVDKLIRLEKMQHYTVTIDGPFYESYSDRTKGFNLFATIHNNTSELVEFTLKDFMVFFNNRLWAPTSSLVGYGFTKEHILPNTARTLGKIWSGQPWNNQQLNDNDYIVFSIDKKGWVYSYKFVMRNGAFEIDDYYSYLQ